MNDEIWRFIEAAQKSRDAELGRGCDYFKESLHSPWISLDSRIGSLLIYERDPDLGEEHGIRQIALFLKKLGITISMDGRDRCRDNAKMERFWWALKYEDIKLKDYVSLPQQRRPKLRELL